MYKRKIWFFASLTTTIFTIALLISGSSLLVAPLGGTASIPFGTIITWAGMISLPLTIYWGIKELRRPTTKLNTLLAGFLKVVIVLGILWVPLSFLLAGNLSFTFSERESFQGGQTAMKWFWYLSYGIGIGALLTLFIYWVSLLFNK